MLLGTAFVYCYVSIVCSLEWHISCFIMWWRSRIHINQVNFVVQRWRLQCFHHDHLNSVPLHEEHSLIYLLPEDRLITVSMNNASFLKKNSCIPPSLSLVSSPQFIPLPDFCLATPEQYKICCVVFHSTRDKQFFKIYA